MEPNFQSMQNNNSPMSAPDPALLHRGSKHRGPIILGIIAIVLGALWFLVYIYSPSEDIKYSDSEKFNLLEQTSGAVTKSSSERLQDLNALQSGSSPVKKNSEQRMSDLNVLNK